MFGILGADARHCIRAEPPLPPPIVLAPHHPHWVPWRCWCVLALGQPLRHRLEQLGRRRDHRSEAIPLYSGAKVRDGSWHSGRHFSRTGLELQPLAVGEVADEELAWARDSRWGWLAGGRVARSCVSMSRRLGFFHRGVWLPAVEWCGAHVLAMPSQQHHSAFVVQQLRAGRRMDGAPAGLTKVTLHSCALLPSPYQSCWLRSWAFDWSVS